MKSSRFLLLMASVVGIPGEGVYSTLVELVSCFVSGFVFFIVVELVLLLVCTDFRKLQKEAEEEEDSFEWEELDELHVHELPIRERTFSKYSRGGGSPIRRATEKRVKP